jgi:phage replication-related protein YjqB (UPF0714/DUF867 family)
MNLMADRYRNFADLAAHEVEEIDYAVCCLARHSPVTVIAPHGGYIEPRTSEVARMIAAERCNLCCFEGLRAGRPHGDLHITSRHFDEPRCMNLVAGSELVVAVHGCLDRGDPDTTLVGGLDWTLRDAIGTALSHAGFDALTTAHRFPGTHPDNICNRGSRGAGCQLELPMSLRDRLGDDPALLALFSEAVASAIEQRLDAAH